MVNICVGITGFRFPPLSRYDVPYNFVCTKIGLISTYHDRIYILQLTKDRHSCHSNSRSRYRQDKNNRKYALMPLTCAVTCFSERADVMEKLWTMISSTVLDSGSAITTTTTNYNNGDERDFDTKGAKSSHDVVCEQAKGETGDRATKSEEKEHPHLDSGDDVSVTARRMVQVRHQTVIIEYFPFHANTLLRREMIRHCERRIQEFCPLGVIPSEHFFRWKSQNDEIWKYRVEVMSRFF